MSIIDKSGQRVGDNSSAIQVAGNATIGNSTSEVIEICKLVVMEKFSTLREEAMNVAMQRVQEFAVNITNRLSSELDSKIEEKLKEPDLQFAISEATTIVAKKGNKTKSELLQEIIVSKIYNESEDTDLLLDHALEITKRLTTSEIKLLAFIALFRATDIFVEKTPLKKIIKDYKNNIVCPFIKLDECYSLFKRNMSLDNPLIRKILIDQSSITPVNIRHLEVKGCLYYNRNYNQSFLDIISQNSAHPIDSDESLFTNFPDIEKIIKVFGINSTSELDQIVPNGLGEIIAKNFINAQGGLN